MKVTYNWLKDFLDIKIPPRELADKLTMMGLEVGSIEESGGDFIFEIEITSNRPDWLSVVGLSREIAAVTGKSIKDPYQKTKLKENKKSPLHITIENKKDCPFYTGRVIKNIKVGPASGNIIKRLELIGCRSVNNVVDITNYVLFESGQPLHAFDLDKLGSDKIVVRRAKRSEKILTIDGQEKALTEEILVIADHQKPIAIAGIMGGKDTEVDINTKNVLLESAVFDPVVVRRSRQLLGLQSDSAYRFERCVDAHMTDKASRYAAGLIKEISAGEVFGVVSTGGVPKKDSVISLDILWVEKILGCRVDKKKIVQILIGLGFKVTAAGKNKIKVIVPSHRPDVKLAVDLVEEIARVYGFENIPVSLPPVKAQVITRTNVENISLIKNVMAGLGLNEAITYSLIDRDLLKGLESDFSSIAGIINPLSKEQEILRPSIVPSLAGCVARNINQKQESIALFEVSNVFALADNAPKESLNLGIILSGSREIWTNQGRLKEEFSLLNLKGVIESLLERLGLKGIKFETGSDRNKVEMVYLGERIGLMLALKRNVLENLHIKNRGVFTAEIYLDKIFPLMGNKMKFSPLPLYPAISRDISILVKENIGAQDILKAIESCAEPLLKESSIKDYYKGKQIPEGFKNLTISCVYRSADRTLTETEVNPVHQKISAVLADKFSATFR